FLVHMLPVALGGLAITYGWLRWAYAAELREPFGERLATVPVALDRPLVVKGLAVFGVAVVAWLAGGPLPLVAISAGAVMVAIAQRDPAYASTAERGSRRPSSPPLSSGCRGSGRTAPWPGSVRPPPPWSRAGPPGPW